MIKAPFYTQNIERLWANAAQADVPILQNADLLTRLQQQMREGELACATVPFWQEDLPELARWAQHIQTRFKRLVVLGTGGSSLGARMLVELARNRPSSTEICFVENIDPHTIHAALHNGTALKDTCVLSVSKSGGTVETLTQTLVFLDAILRDAAIAHVGEHMLVLTGKGDSPLRRLATQHDIPTLEHPEHIGGRFSVFTAVGLLPAMVAGVDAVALRAGARSVVDACCAADALSACAPALGAASLYALLQQGMHSSVLMPYSDQLFELGAWYRQLWAESLGKDGKGMTPIRALGVVDQHSQLQLYLDGPKDKVFTIVTAGFAGQGAVIPDALVEKEPALHYLRHHTVGDVIAAEQQSTVDTLASSGCPVRVLHVAHVNEHSLGALLMHFMLETLFMAELMQVDPFDQPAVEDGKQRTRDLLAGAAIV